MAKAIGKNKKRGYYFQVYAEWFTSPSYRDLSVHARCLLNEFLNIYRPSRNGQLSISSRKASELLSCSENTCLKAFDELMEHGFLILVNFENWTQRKAREFELTVMERDGRVAKDLWKQWEKGKPVCKVRRKNKSRPQIVGQSASKNGAVLLQKVGQR